MAKGFHNPNVLIESFGKYLVQNELLLLKWGINFNTEENSRTSLPLERENVRILLHNITMVDIYPNKMELGMLHLKLQKKRLVVFLYSVSLS